MSTETSQVVGDRDSAALVRVEDLYRNFSHTPLPSDDLDEAVVEFHAKAAQTIQDIVYAGAQRNTAKL